MPKTALFSLSFFAVVSVLALALVAAPRPAAAQPGWHPAPIPVAQKQRRTQRDSRIIACRPGGCFRIPLGCYTEAEYDMWGNPTGYDKIICPGR